MEKKTYIYGKNVVMESLKASKGTRLFMVSHFDDENLLKLAKKNHLEIERVSKERIHSLVGNVNHQGVVLEINAYEYADFQGVLKKIKDKKDALVLLLDGLEDPQNLGAILRSADAFGVDLVILPKSRSVSVTPVVQRVSTGASAYVPVCLVSNLNQAIQKLKEENFWIVASDGYAKVDYDTLDYKMRVGLVVGSEGKGISSLVLKNADYITKIPMVGHVNSLNASVAAGIYLALIDVKRREK